MSAFTLLAHNVQFRLCPIDAFRRPKLAAEVLTYQLTYGSSGVPASDYMITLDIST
jgi:hypothetical protein